METLELFEKVASGEPLESTVREYIGETDAVVSAGTTSWSVGGQFPGKTPDSADTGTAKGGKRPHVDGASAAETDAGAAAKTLTKKPSVDALAAMVQAAGNDAEFQNEELEKAVEAGLRAMFEKEEKGGPPPDVQKKIDARKDKEKDEQDDEEDDEEEMSEKDKKKKNEQDDEEDDEEDDEDEMSEKDKKKKKNEQGKKKKNEQGKKKDEQDDEDDDEEDEKKPFPPKKESRRVNEEICSDCGEEYFGEVCPNCGAEAVIDDTYADEIDMAIESLKENYVLSTGKNKLNPQYDLGQPVTVEGKAGTITSQNPGPQGYIYTVEFKDGSPRQIVPHEKVTPTLTGGS